jgi:hypothetical protein
MSRFSCRWPKAQSTTLSPRHHFNRLDQPLALGRESLPISNIPLS